jgi:hypothetical protein
MSRQGEPLRLHANDVTGLPGSHLKKTGFKTISTVPPTRFTHKFPAHAIAQTPIQIQ